MDIFAFQQIHTTGTLVYSFISYVRLAAVFVEQRRLAAAFARDDDLVGGAQRLAAKPRVDLALVSDAKLDVVGDEGVENGVRDLIADLVGMPFRNGFAGEQTVRA